MPFRYRILGSFLLIIILFSISIVYNIFFLNRTSAQIREITDRLMVLDQAVRTARNQVLTIHSEIWDTLVLGDINISDAVSNLDSHAVEFYKALHVLQGGLQKEYGVLKDIRMSFQGYFTYSLSLIESGGLSLLKNSRDQALIFNRSKDELTYALNGFYNRIKSDFDNDLKNLNNGFNRSYIIMAGITAAALVLSVFLAFLLTGLITRPVKELTELAKEIEKGRYEIKIRSALKGEFRLLGSAFESMARELNTVVEALNQEIEERLQVEFSLVNLNRELESRVEERTRELTDNNKDLESFSYSVSHDLRAPLRAISGYSKIIKDEYGPRLDKDGLDMIEKVVRACDKMGHLIEDLLYLARVSRGEIHRQIVEVSTMAGMIINDYRSSEPARKVEFICREGLTVHADAGLMYIVMNNLLGNAWKYTSRREEARIELGNQALDGQEWLTIKDNGAGFNMNYSDKLFKPFQRLHQASDFEGNGIGLAIVDKIVRRHGGAVRIESIVDQGTTVFFRMETAAVKPAE